MPGGLEPRASPQARCRPRGIREQQVRGPNAGNKQRIAPRSEAPQQAIDAQIPPDGGRGTDDRHTLNTDGGQRALVKCTRAVRAHVEQGLEPAVHQGGDEQSGHEQDAEDRHDGSGPQQHANERLRAGEERGSRSHQAAPVLTPVATGGLACV